MNELDVWFRSCGGREGRAPRRARSVHRGSCGSVVRRSEDLLDDFVEVLDFVARIWASLARDRRGKLEVEGVVKHLHHREGIADFVGDLGGEQPERESFSFWPIVPRCPRCARRAGLFNGGAESSASAERMRTSSSRLIAPAGIDVEGADGFAGEMRGMLSRATRPSRRATSALIALEVWTFSTWMGLRRRTTMRAGFPRRSGGVFARSFAGAVAGAEIEPFTAFIEHEQRAHLGLHHTAGFG